MNFDWRLFAFASAFFAALTAVLAKVGVAGVNSSFATFYRTLVVLLLSALVVWRAGAWQPLTSVAPKSLLFLTLSGAATGLSWLCYFKALQLGPASRVAPIDKLSVVLVVLFAAAFLHETLELENRARQPVDRRGRHRTGRVMRYISVHFGLADKAHTAGLPNQAP